MTKYYVVGGEYKDTCFREMVGGKEKWFGPYETYESAKKEWQRIAWKTVDDATARYRIERIDEESPPPCTD